MSSLSWSFFYSSYGRVQLAYPFIDPIPLIYLPVMVYRAIKGKKDYYHTINIVCLTSFMMIMPFIQQKFNVTVLPLALCLLICSANHVYYITDKTINERTQS